MAQDIKITPGSGTPQILFVGSGTATSGIELNIQEDSDLSYAGYQGELFNMGPELQTGTVFSVKDISGVDHIAVNASGDVKINEFYGATYVFNLPTSDPWSAGQLWKDGTDLKVSEAFEPDYVDGLDFWVDAQRTPSLFQDEAKATGVVADGNAVAVWEDRVLGTDYAQTTAASRPVYTGNVINGHPGILFDGTDDYLETATMLSGYSGSLYWVAESSVISAHTVVFAEGKTDATSNTVSFGLSHPVHNSGAIRAAANTPNDQITSNAATLPTVAAICCMESNGTAWAGRINGSGQSFTVRAGSNNGQWWSDQAGDRMTIGARRTQHGGSDPFNGYIGEILVYDSVLSTGDQASVEAYLSRKWGVSL